MSRSRMAAGITAACSVLPVAVLAAMWLFPFVGPPETMAQTAPDSPGIAVDAGAVLLHRAPVHTPNGSTANGKVVLEATLDAKGEVSDARVISGPEELRKEALASVLQWHYQPGPAVAQISIQFGTAGPTPSVATSLVPQAPPAPRTVSDKQVAEYVNRVSQNLARNLKNIEFAGISPEAEQQLRQRLPIRVGDTVSSQDMAAVTTEVKAFDSHLNAAFTLGNDGTTLRIAAAPAAMAGVGFVTGVAGGRGGGSAAPGMTPAQLATGAYPSRDGVTNPVPISRPEPQYSEEARKAKWGGTVLLSVVVDENGLPQNIKIIKPLGLGLDEKAIEAVTQWRFKPGTKNGVPVAVTSQIEVTFRTLD